MIRSILSSSVVCTFCKYVRQAVWQISPFFIGLGLLILAYEVERRYFPVIRDFKVSSIVRTPSGIVIQGTMRKVRDCEFLQLTGYTDDTKPVNVTFLETSGDTEAKTRVVGFQFWGTLGDLGKWVAGSQLI